MYNHISNQWFNGKSAGQHIFTPLRNHVTAHFPLNEFQESLGQLNQQEWELNLHN
jgi:hypothetical protein